MIPGRIAAGEYPGAKDPDEAAARLRTLLLAGIDHFIDLTEARTTGLEPYAAIAAGGSPPIFTRMSAHERHPSRRRLGVPGSPREMAGILDAIDAALDGGKTVYVHCWGGIGRTGTVVGCWLVRHGARPETRPWARSPRGGRGVQKVRTVSLARRKRPAQHAFVRDWAEPAQKESAA